MADGEQEERRIEVIFGDYPFPATVKHEMSPVVPVEMLAGSVEEDDLVVGFLQAFRDLKHGLALAGLTGRIEPVRDVVMGEGAAKPVDQAMASLTEADLRVTDEDIQRAYDRDVQALRLIQERMQKLGEFTADAQRREEEGENPTVLEAIVRHQEEGTKLLERIVDPQDEVEEG
jgi:hypothetical protein